MPIFSPIEASLSLIRSETLEPFTLLVQLFGAFDVVGNGCVGDALGKGHEVGVLGNEIGFAGNGDDKTGFVVGVVFGRSPRLLWLRGRCVLRLLSGPACVSQSIAASKSPPVSVRALRQSIMPAPVAWRSLLISWAVIVTVDIAKILRLFTCSEKVFAF
jgi:hypothetical protein